ncbi:MAG: hypothetical protein WC520_03825 [Candidatus Paceibacterota bacterium]
MKILGVLLIVVGLVLAVWLAIFVMLYGGIMQAINNWDTNTAAAVWGVIRAFFFEFGFVPGAILVVVGTAVVSHEPVRRFHFRRYRR